MCMKQTMSMSKYIWVSLMLFFLLGCSGGKQQQQKAIVTEPGDGLTGTIQLSGAFALYPMVVRWAEEFKRIHPGVKIDISGGGAGKGMTDVLSGVVDIGMVSREIYPEELKKQAYPIATVKDAVVLTVNVNNPEIDVIRKVGITKEMASRLWSRGMTTWGEVLGTTSTLPVHVFTRSDACGAAETFASWFGKRQEALQATAVFGDPGVAAAIQKDKVGIGYNNVAYVYDQRTKRPFEGLEVIPIDLNEDGRISEEESFYQTSEILVKAIGEGRYPSPPAHDLFLVTKGRPQKEVVVAFLEYVLTDGQYLANETGYIGLSNDQLADERDKLKLNKD